MPYINKEEMYFVIDGLKEFFLRNQEINNFVKKAYDSIEFTHTSPESEFMNINFGDNSLSSQEYTLQVSSVLEGSVIFNTVLVSQEHPPLVLIEIEQTVDKAILDSFSKSKNYEPLFEEFLLKSGERLKKAILYSFLKSTIFSNYNAPREVISQLIDDSIYELDTKDSTEK